MWEISNLNQISSFLRSILLGGIFCIIFDVFRSIRKEFNNSVYAVFAEDLLCFSIWAPVTFCFLLATTNGELRFYVFFGIISGFWIFRFALSPLLLVFITSILKFFTLIIRFISEFCARLRWYILRFFVFLRKNFSENIKKALNISKKLLKKR